MATAPVFRGCRNTNLELLIGCVIDVLIVDRCSQFVALTRVLTVSVACYHPPWLPIGLFGKLAPRRGVHETTPGPRFGSGPRSLRVVARAFIVTFLAARRLSPTSRQLGLPWVARFVLFVARCHCPLVVARRALPHPIATHQDCTTADRRALPRSHWLESSRPSLERSALSSRRARPRLSRLKAALHRRALLLQSSARAAIKFRAL